jgi:sugar phosphate isomerase/epimerase
MKTLPVAIQVYSIRGEAEQDFVGAMKEVKKIGYDGVELAGLYGHTPVEIRDILKEIGLTPISAHVPYHEFEQDLEGTVQTYATIGCRFVAIPYLLEDYRYGTDKFNEVMTLIPDIAKECKKYGITLLYHNHDFEFLKTTDDRYILDYMYEEIPAEELQVEPDTCWIKKVNVDPAEYIKKYSGRCPVVHLKDFKTEPFEFRALGKGIQNIPSILEAALNAGTEWVVAEQDSHSEHTPMEDARLSREYLRTLGW